jgi:endonuclease YncB( thermonuclease family)
MRKGNAAILDAVAALLVTSTAASAQHEDALCRLEPGSAHTVVAIIDAETLRLDNGREVRLIGALAPRARDVGAKPGAWQAEEQAREALSALVLNKSVTLAFGGSRTDRYDRWLAEVFVGEGDAAVWVQGHMLKSGHARSYALSGNRACERQRLAAERSARTQSLGLWSTAAYRLRQTWPARALLDDVGTYQVIRGRVARVSSGREVTYLNFSQSSAFGLSASLNNSDRALLGAIGGDAKALQGRVVEIRGWVGQRTGPIVDLTLSGQIDLAAGDVAGMGSGSEQAAPSPRSPNRASQPRASGARHRDAVLTPLDAGSANGEQERPAQPGAGR